MTNQPLKLLFLRPPRHYWPILNEGDNFLLPLAYPTLAGYIRKFLPEIEIRILDCCAYRMGWKSLKEFIASYAPDVVAIGEKVCYCAESERAFKLVKEINPKIITLAGGQYYSHVVEETFQNNPAVDYILRFEGEVAMTHFLKRILENKEVTDTPNLVYKKDNQLVYNPIAPLVDMTTLPSPAYDLASLDKYQAFGILWPKAATIQRSRGCTNNCHYCSWIAQESVHMENKETNTFSRKAIFRSKTPAQMLEEIDILYLKHNIRYLIWVDASWNHDDDWMNEFCDGLIQRKYDLRWWAFIRLDYIARQHQNGTLKKMVKAGLRHILSGADRSDTEGLNQLNKRSQNHSSVKEALQIFKKYYPEVFRQCTFIVGLPEDTEEKIKAQLKYAHDIDVDFAAFHTLTPFPGTPFFKYALESGLVMEKDFSNYDMYFPVMKTKYLSQAEVAKHMEWCQMNFILKKPFRYFFRLFSIHSIRRNLHWWFVFSSTRVLVLQIINHIRGIQKFEGFSGVNKLWKPIWYDN